MNSRSINVRLNTPPVNNIRGRVAFAVTVLAVFVAPMEAAVFSFTNEAAYDVAVGAELFFIDFDGLPVGTSDGNFLGQVDFGSPESATPTDVLFNSDAMTDGGSTIAANFVGPIDGTFATPVNAFGLVFSSSGTPQTVEIYDASDGLIGSVASNPGGFFWHPFRRFHFEFHHPQW